MSAVDPEITADPSSSFGKEGSTAAAVQTPAPGRSFRRILEFFLVLLLLQRQF